MNHLLVVEQDAAAAHVLAATLEFGGFTCDVAENALGAMKRLSDGSYDAILMDVDLPDLDGSQLISAAQFHRGLPVVVVSAQASEEHKINALDAGADDFVAKPFSPGELLARIRAVLRRAGRTHASRGDVRNAAIAPPEQPTGTAALARLKLGRLERSLLDLLLTNEGRAVSVDEISSHLWSSDKGEGSSHVRVLIASLRRKLQAQGQQLEILNERGEGYRIS